jgi:hypothetical protein
MNALARKTLTWQEKWAAIKVIQPGADVKMRRPVDWYVSASMEHAHDTCMLVGDYGNGPTPRAAIEAHWREYTDGRPFFCGGKWHVWSGTEWLDTVDPRP